MKRMFSKLPAVVVFVVDFAAQIHVELELVKVDVERMFSLEMISVEVHL